MAGFLTFNEIIMPKQKESYDYKFRKQVHQIYLVTQIATKEEMIVKSKLA